MRILEECGTRIVTGHDIEYFDETVCIIDYLVTNFRM